MTKASPTAPGFNIRWNRYIPHIPTPKQAVFLSLTCREAFFGGAAGGGKSDALLMAALQYVDVPGYSAIIFRKSFTDLSLPGALIDRSHEWLSETDAKYDHQNHAWRFPRGGTLAFGYLDHELAKYRYQSAEFAFVGFDELTQIPGEPPDGGENGYTFMFSRLRKLACSIHRVGEDGSPIYISKCKECQIKKTIPVRMRAASNPGGVGHHWVRDRFQIKLDPDLRDDKLEALIASYKDQVVKERENDTHSS